MEKAKGGWGRMRDKKAAMLAMLGFEGENRDDEDKPKRGKQAPTSGGIGDPRHGSWLLEVYFLQFL